MFSHEFKLIERLVKIKFKNNIKEHSDEWITDITENAQVKDYLTTFFPQNPKIRKRQIINTAESMVSSLSGDSMTIKERFSGGGGEIDWLFWSMPVC